MSKPSSLSRLRPWQFSIGQMLFATTLICVGVALFRRVPELDYPLVVVIPGLLVISVVSSVLATVFGIRASSQRTFRLRRLRQFSLGQLLASVGLVGIALGVSRFYFQHPDVVVFLIMAMLVILAICSTVAVIAFGPIMLLFVTVTTMRDSERCEWCTTLALYAVYGLAYWELLLS
jgi:hypothetical protein